MKYTSCTVSDSRVELFQNLTLDEMDELQKNMVTIRYKKGETICRLGTLAPYIILVKEGLANAFIEGCDDVLVVNIIPPGNFIALSVVANTNGMFPYSSKAYVNTEVALIDIKVFRELLSKNILFANDVLKLVSAHLQQVYGRFYCISTKQLYGRLADILICLSEKIFKCNSFNLVLSRQELAQLTKMSTESIIRLLKKFKDDGLIDMDGKLLTILDLDRLRKIADTG
ncbi:MAG TPA: hypothetical protein DCM62_03185 [Bacteroidales bacterium]|nr:hypothetical protein [Bacteroidales bacterium]